MTSGGSGVLRVLRGHLVLEGAHLLLLHLLVHSLHLLMHELPGDRLLHLVLLWVAGSDLLIALAHHGLLLLELVLLQHLLVVPLLLGQVLLVVVHGDGFRGNDVFWLVRGR